jgi:hypothetical protein
VGASTSVRLVIAAAIGLGSASVPALAGPTGSSQPGATPVPPGSFIVLRDVPARNAIISGAGDALAVQMGPPASAFDAITGVGARLSDVQAASVTGSLSAGAGGRAMAASMDHLFGAQSMSGGAADRASGAGAGGAISSGLQSGLAPLHNLFGALGGTRP